MFIDAMVERDCRQIGSYFGRGCITITSKLKEGKGKAWKTAHYDDQCGFGQKLNWYMWLGTSQAQPEILSRRNRSNEHTYRSSPGYLFSVHVPPISAFFSNIWNSTFSVNASWSLIAIAYVRVVVISIRGLRTVQYSANPIITFQ